MNRTKIYQLSIRIIATLGLFVTMSFGTGVALFGMGVLNLTITILAFDELFVNSPFDQTSMATIEANLTTMAQSAVLMAVLGILIAIFCGVSIFFALFGEFNKKEENDAK